MKATFYSKFKPHYETIAPHRARVRRLGGRVGRTLARALPQAFERAYEAAGEAVTAAQVSGRAGLPIVLHGRAMRAAARGLDEGALAIGRAWSETMVGAGGR